MLRKLPRATIDFETRSTVSLKAVGTWQYSIHPKTEVLCLVFRLPHWPSAVTSYWHPEFPVCDIQETYEANKLAELFDWITSGKIVEAHGAWFERCIWKNIMVARYGFPDIDQSQWRCSAAQAAVVSYPRGLDVALKAANLALRKDAEGSKVMKKMTKPRKPRKAEREAWALAHGSAPHPTLYWESQELLDKLLAYCRQDVLAEEGLSYVLPDLSASETELYLLDQRINERGFQLDRDAVTAALSLLAKETAKLNAELSILTKGKVHKATQRDRMLMWLEEDEGLSLPNTTADTLDDWLASDEPMTPAARRGIEIMRTLGRSSTAKYQSMKNWMSKKDARVRGGLLFHGASTGRWTGSGVQPHNFPKGTLKEDSEPNKKIDIERLWRILKVKNTRPIKIYYKTTVMEALAHALRGAIVARKNHDLYVADFAAIEARVVLWLADDQEALDIFRQHKDIYCDMASSIYGYKVNKDKHPTERGMGKIAILGLGYQMGAAKFLATCANFGITITEEFAKKVVDTYREKYWRVKQLWYDQEAAAIKCVKTGKIQQCGYVTWTVDKKFLYCGLPSGRKLAYPNPIVRDEATSWGAQKETLTFMGVDSYTHQWRRQTTYGGMIVENITQAVARDLLAEAISRCEQTGVYLPVLSVHDEVIAEVARGTGSLKEFDSLLKQVPKWARGCPVDADSWCGPRYQKK